MFITVPMSFFRLRVSSSKRRKLKKIFDHTVFWLMSYPTILVLLAIFGLLVLTKRVKIVHKERIPKHQENLIIAPNHPSLWEPILMMAFQPWESLLHPLQFIPWSTPDEKNYRRWFWIPVRQRFIFVPRGKAKGELKALVEIIRVLRAGKRVIIFGESGRTETGKGNRFQYSPKGKKIRPLKRGLGFVACRAGSTILPVWIDGAERVLPVGSVFPRIWRQVVVRFGEPYKAPDANEFDKVDMNDGVGWVLTEHTRAVLELADEDD